MICIPQAPPIDAVTDVATYPHSRIYPTFNGVFYHTNPFTHKRKRRPKVVGRPEDTGNRSIAPAQAGLSAAFRRVTA